jgi:RhtB (resistance to homoserine/threonine) family protein
MLLTQFLTVAIVHLLAVISPGPDFAMVSRNSLIYSRRVGIYTALGIALGLGVHITYSLLGIGLIISRSIILFNTIKWIGALYLIYIGIKSLRAKPQAPEIEKGIEKEQTLVSDFKAFKIGFLTNVLNPKATLFILAVFTQVFSLSTPLIVQIICGIEMIVATFIWFSIVAGIFSHSQIKSKLKGIQHHIERVTGAVLIGLGIKVALSSKQ